MAENRISYLDRTYDDFRNDFMELTKKYYPDMISNFGDASISQWLIELFASISDELSFHIDRSYQETSLDSAQQRDSLLKLARNNGVKIPGPKSAIVEVELSCTLPMVNSQTNSMPDMEYAPTIKRGTLFSDGSNTFELMYDVDFNEQFDENGVSNRQIEPRRDANGNIVGYTLKKLAIASAGQSKIYKKIITNADMVPFLKITLTDTNITGVESIIVKEGTNLNSNPTIDEFYVDEERYVDKSTVNNVHQMITRFFEVDSLIEQYRFGEEIERSVNGYYNPVYYQEIAPIESENGENTKMEYLPFVQHVRGQWKRLKHKFITEYNGTNNLDIIFGPGLEDENGRIETNYENAKAFTKYMMSKMMANDYMGVCPVAGTTMFILYRIGGGAMTNIAKNTLTNISYLNACLPVNNSHDYSTQVNNSTMVKRSIRVTNPTPSYGGKNAPNNDEIRYLVKYATAAQNRCVTVKDYSARLLQLPAKFGAPFRTGVVEENNKIVIYALGLDYEGKLMSALSETVSENILTYLEHYRMINDFVEMKSGKIINLQFDVDVIADKSYNKSEVAKRVIDTVYDYMDIRKHAMGEDIFLGDLIKEISKLDGVVNLIELRCFNKVYTNNAADSEYSPDRITQPLVNKTDCVYGDAEQDAFFSSINQIDLRNSDMTLYSDVNSMFEIRNKNKDIRVRVKER